MKSYFAFHGKTVISGGFSHCLTHAAALVAKNNDLVVKLCCARGGEKNARVLAEVSADGLAFCRAGRTVRVSDLIRNRG